MGYKLIFNSHGLTREINLSFILPDCDLKNNNKNSFRWLWISLRGQETVTGSWGGGFQITKGVVWVGIFLLTLRYAPHNNFSGKQHCGVQWSPRGAGERHPDSQSFVPLSGPLCTSLLFSQSAFSVSQIPWSADSGLSQPVLWAPGGVHGAKAYTGVWILFVNPSSGASASARHT